VLPVRAVSITALQLQSNGVWKARPGCRVLIIDGGALRFDYPQDWILHAGADSVCLVAPDLPERPTVLAASVKRISMPASMIPLELYMREIAEFDPRVLADVGGDFVRVRRPPLEAGWVESHLTDPRDGREISKRICFARAGCTRALIAFQSWLEDRARMDAVWETVLDTLAVGDYLEDIATGRRREKRG